LSLREIIQSKMEQLPRGQKAVALYVLEHAREAVSLTASELGKVVGVSEATVIRFASSLGFPGYPEFREALQESLLDQLKALERHQLYQTVGEGNNFIQSVLRQDLQKGINILATLDDRPIEDLARAICESSCINIVGLRSAKGLAYYFSAYLSWFIPETHVLNADMFLENVINARGDSLFIGISFPRYTKRTVQCLALARELGKKTAAITDSPLSPLAPHADILVYAPCSHISFIDSFVIPVGLVNAVLLKVADNLGELTTKRLQELERAWDQYGVYEDRE